MLLGIHAFALLEDRAIAPQKKKLGLRGEEGPMHPSSERPSIAARVRPIAFLSGRPLFYR